MCLGGSIARAATDQGTECWKLSSEKHVKTAVANLKESLKKSNLKLPSKCSTPFSSGHHPAEDTTSKLDAEGTRYYQELIRVLRWAIELGRADMLLEVALLSIHLALPRVVHLQQASHVRTTVLTV